MYIVVTMDTVAISDLRANLPALINQTSEKLKRLVVTVAGKPKAVILSFDELESLEETAEIMAMPQAFEKIKKGVSQAKKGQGISLDKLD